MSWSVTGVRLIVDVVESLGVANEDYRGRHVDVYNLRIRILEVKAIGVSTYKSIEASCEVDSIW